jgi:Tfp pilus assembly protein FimT
MASTYVNDLRLNEMATGDASGSWGTVTNTNLELIGEAFSYGTETIGDADSTLTIADGASDPVRSFFLKITSSVDLTTTRIVTIAPNTVSKVWMIENATTGSQVITIKQGSGATINVPNGQVKMISTDGAGSGGAVLDLLVDVDLTGTTTLVNLDVSGAVDIAGDLTLSAGGDGALRFTAASSVKVLDNDAAALVFEEADNAYMTFVTTDGSEAVKFDKALDINAATQIDATVTVGVDDTGYDVKFFGATTGKSLLWDESADSLIITGSTSLQGGLEVGVDDTGYDVKFFGATAGKYMLWDESADTLEVSGTVVAGAGTALLPSITTTGDLNTGMWFPAADTIAFSEGGVEALRIDSSGNVGIGTSSPSTTLHLSRSDDARLKLTDTGDSCTFTVRSDGDNTSIGTDTAHPVRFTTNNTERMRIDSSGNLLVGKTASTGVTAGAELRSDGYGVFTRSGGESIQARRLTDDGDIVVFLKDTDEVGTIGASGGDFYITCPGSVGIKFDDANNAWRPCNNVGDSRDNAIDAGAASARLDDIYATNNVINTSDRNEKQDIDVMSEAETRVAVACKGLMRKFRWIDAVAKKGDDARIHFGIIAQDLQDAFAAEGLDAGRYAMFISSTWWETQTDVPAVEAVAEVLDEEGNVVTEAVEAKEAYIRTNTFMTLEEAPEGATERTRLGVRYPELLAFIIGAL